jgi:hypothetical protein
MLTRLARKAGARRQLPALRFGGSEAYACGGTAAEPGPCTPPVPGTVPEYDAHVLLRLPRPASHRDEERRSGAWWPAVVEREPTVLGVFRALAQASQLIDGARVKVRAPGRAVLAVHLVAPVIRCRAQLPALRRPAPRRLPSLPRPAALAAQVTAFDYVSDPPLRRGVPTAANVDVLLFPSGEHLRSGRGGSGNSSAAGLRGR